MQSLVPFLSDGFGVKIPFQDVLEDRSEVLIRMDSFYRCIMHMDCPVNVLRCPDISYHLLCFVHIQVKV